MHGRLVRRESSGESHVNIREEKIKGRKIRDKPRTWMNDRMK